MKHRFKIVNAYHRVYFMCHNCPAYGYYDRFPGGSGYVECKFTDEIAERRTCKNTMPGRLDRIWRRK